MAKNVYKRAYKTHENARKTHENAVKVVSIRDLKGRIKVYKCGKKSRFLRKKCVKSVFFATVESYEKEVIY